MRYRQDQFQAYIAALQRGKRRNRRRTGWLLLVLVTLTAVYFGIQLNPCASSISSRPGIPQPSPMARFEGPIETIRVPPACRNPGARSPWEQQFGEALQTKTVRAARGDTLIRILHRAGIDYEEAYAVIEALKPHFDPASLRQGHELCLDFITCEGYSPVFQRLRLKLDAKREVQLIRGVSSGFSVRRVTRELKAHPARSSATIHSSLYQAARKAKIPMEILMQVLRAYSYDVDFQRDIQPGDRIEVLYEKMVDADGEYVRPGTVLYSALLTRGRTLRLYRHRTSDDSISRLFDAQGNSIQKALMVTPVDGARLSSGYGMRRHPILGYNKMHRGLDFAAPTGTPIMAAGDGIVEYAGPRGNYGNYIRIRHPNLYQTVYGHLSGYAKGIKSGVRVKQGETIGFVGSTGRSTGPHLHFEVRHDGTPVNPTRIKTPPGRALEGEALERFLLTKNRLEALYASLTEADSDRKLAAADSAP
jgi:murein DD-endopeptidase MepM/ murein hydrolase activator NlpD